MESSDAEATDSGEAEGDTDTDENNYDPPAFRHAYSSRSMAVAVVDGSILADSTDVKGMRKCLWTILHQCTR